MNKKISLFMLMTAAVTLSVTGIPAYAYSSQNVTLNNLDHTASVVTDKHLNQVIINGTVMDVPGGILIEKGQKLYPLRWTAQQLGGTVKWDKKTQTVIINNPLFYKEHLYLNYLGALSNNDPNAEYTLPAGAAKLKLPSYPLNDETGLMLHDKPIGITIQDNGFTMEFAAYDYAFKDGRVYVTGSWLNTVFLAQLNETTTETAISSPSENELDKKLQEIEEALTPITPEETLSLWIRGQQLRSGALQYSSLSPELKEKVLAAKADWVTGYSSPSAGKATIISKEQPADDTIVYKLSIDSLLQEKHYETLEQEITLKKYTQQGKTVWLISNASGRLDDFSILAKR